jgi:4-alpha-glucanotransferase
MTAVAGPAPTGAGVQLHLTSLPGGRMGPEAFAFVDWMADAGLSWWQMLPLGPPDRERSPYRSKSAFACWPELVGDPDAPVDDDEVASFRARHRFWVGDWQKRAGGRRAVAAQVRFEREWTALRAHAADRGVRLIGDVPIYVAPGSVDHTANPDLFLPDVVAGVPPDAFSDTGQLWGNPLFDWPVLQRRKYRWWVERLRRTFDLFDVTRIDHFRGFVSYWAVPAEAATAIGGRWVRGPGRAVFDAAAAELGPLPVIAEDLGVITEPVTRLRTQLGFPGMVVLQFGFDEPDGGSTHHPDRHQPNSVCYTGTHDNDTARGWWESLPDVNRTRVRAAAAEVGVDGDEPEWALIALALRSPASLAMVQVQDVLGLGGEARMNLPGQAKGNWRWQLAPGQLTADHATRLRALVADAGRLPGA